ncbi:HdeD family acid-resistance protein [Wohlfahrtiimonas populi]|jgi:uncharacterized membrane protein HdeD (DUF308 family)|uniref:HdeD family acid-resistance protein n=1 Tax=Wohlfahrtiimonas populi TaxID=1940240 RepID=UPI00098D0CC7|nr:DUF308 domain-containing protein [Wohlfahrtiimonas populi]
MTNTRENNNWWLTVIIGILFIIIGIWSLLTPASTLLTIAYFVGFMFLMTGIFEVFSVSAGNSNWGWSLLSGAIDIIIGVLFISMPAGEAILVICFLFGFWVLFRSFLGLGIILSLKNSDVPAIANSSKGIMLLPIIGIILGFVFLMSPIVAGGFIVGIFSVAIISFGIFELYWGFFLKKNS